MPIDGCTPHIVGILSQRAHGEVKNSWATPCGLDVSQKASSSTRTTNSSTSRWTSLINESPTATFFIEVVNSSLRLVIHGHPRRLKFLVGPRMEKEERGWVSAHAQTDRHTDRDRQKQTETDRDRQRQIETETETDRQRQTDSDRQRQTETDEDRRRLAEKDKATTRQTGTLGGTTKTSH